MKRIAWVDICRGIAIILVLYGHVFGSDNQRFLIYAFHMPLFFFISGIVFQGNLTDSIFTFVVKNIKKLLIPYFLFALLTFIAGFLLFQQTYTYPSLIGQFFGILYGNGTVGLSFNVALWFLPCLFITKILFGLLIRWIKKKKTLITTLFLLSLAGYILSSFFPFLKLPFGFEITLTAIVFFGAGYLWQQTTAIKKIMTQRKIILLCLGILLTFIFAAANFYLYGSQVDMRVNRLNNYFLFYLGAFSGIMSCLILSMLITKNTLLAYIGKNSLILFVWHTVLFVYLAKHVFLSFSTTFFYPLIATCCAIAIILLLQAVYKSTFARLQFYFKKGKIKNSK